MTQSKPRFVLDANVFISAALFSQSKPRLVFDKVIDIGSLLLSDAVFEEIESVLFRSKFDRYISFSKRVQFLEELVSAALFIQITTQIKDCRDPKDNKYLELAVCGKAESIISGDDDLLVLHPFYGISIFSPQSFLQS